MSDTSFQVGDVVQLTCGGSYMTVSKIYLVENGEVKDLTLSTPDAIIRCELPPGIINNDLSPLCFKVATLKLVKAKNQSPPTKPTLQSNLEEKLVVYIDKIFKKYVGLLDSVLEFPTEIIPMGGFSAYAQMSYKKGEFLFQRYSVDLKDWEFISLQDIAAQWTEAYKHGAAMHLDWSLDNFEHTLVKKINEIIADRKAQVARLQEATLLVESLL